MVVFTDQTHAGWNIRRTWYTVTGSQHPFGECLKKTNAVESGAVRGC
jgi:hypothetical protein